MQWSISRKLANREGLAWIRSELDRFDWSKCQRITVCHGAWGAAVSRSEGRTNPICGVCRHLSADNDGMFRLSCWVNTRLGWPAYDFSRVHPLIRNEDGTWPAMPARHKVGQWYRDTQAGREWKELFYMMPINDEDEALVLIIAHEACHFLRNTRQIPGQNTEIAVDAYAMRKLMKFREWREKQRRRRSLGKTQKAA